METSLHRALKALYAEDKASTEVRLEGFRIDAVATCPTTHGRLLVEIQHGSLAAIRDKVASLLQRHSVLVVKPIVASKLLVKQSARDGPVVSRRLSPKRGALLDLFDDLVHFTRVFPHRRLLLEAVLVDVEEWRYPGHGRRRRWRQTDMQVQDQRLVRVCQVHRFRTAADLRRLLPDDLPNPFHSAHLADALGIARAQAQRVAYCLRQSGAAREAGKTGNTRLHRFARRRPAA